MQESPNRDQVGLRRALAAVAAWSGFAVAWVLVVRRPGAVVLSEELLVVPLSAVAVAALSAWWIRHNRRIYQRKGPRRGVPVELGPPAQDRLGRPVHLDLAMLLGAQEVVLEANGLAKTYRDVT